jgi:crossover junction endodeoxyribonuclease RusA
MSEPLLVFPSQQITFIAYCTPTPQGSIKAFMIGGKPRLTSDNSKLKPFRHTVAQVAAEAMNAAGLSLPLAAQHVAVGVNIVWTLSKPQSAPKSRIWPSRKPDADKLLRATLDALTGILWYDDAQVVEVMAAKRYGAPESVSVQVQILR